MRREKKDEKQNESDPQTKGSAKAFVVFGDVLAAVDRFRKTGKRIAPRAYITNDNPNAKAWQETIMDAAIQARRGGPLVQGELSTVTEPAMVYIPCPKMLLNAACMSGTPRSLLTDTQNCAGTNEIARYAARQP